MKTYDAIVLGLGGFGSATLCHLAQRGLNVLGIDRFGIAHDRGSSHGETRIIRKAYFEHPDYVPLLLRAYELWAELEIQTAQSLYKECGLFLAGPPQGEVISGARESASRYGVPVEELSVHDAGERFPLFHFDESDAIVFEPEAGYLRVEVCVSAYVNQAVELGATIITDDPVVSWSANGQTVCVITENEIYEAAQLVIAAGAWSGQLLSDLGLPLSVLRKPLMWHEINSPEWTQATTFFFEKPHGCFYGFPSIDGQTVKLAEHTGGELVKDPLFVDRGISPADCEPVSEFVRHTMKDVSMQPQRHAVCMYTMTPDGHFIVDRYPEHENVVLAAGFSGH
ncbi:MAG: N-methyl-L-tryptophan oxidase, partial [Planctomycetaceae bacterium]|nr:N-methyl-L-tryptophan oxidase [Planctomycetaceae bacterium]